MTCWADGCTADALIADVHCAEHTDETREQRHARLREHGLAWLAEEEEHETNQRP